MFSRPTHLAGFDETSAWLLEVVVHDLAQPERQVGDYVNRGHHSRTGRSATVPTHEATVERRRPGPCAFDRDVLEMIFDQFADAWRAVDMRNDLEQKFGAASEALTCARSASRCL
jgi:hypothetical protein